MSETSSERMALAERLKVARIQAGLSQGQIAIQLKMHRPTISEIEAGRRKVSADELGKFADSYKVSITWLAGKSGDSEAPEVELAARELAKLKSEDLDRVMRLLRTLRRSGKGLG